MGSLGLGTRDRWRARATSGGILPAWGTQDTWRARNAPGNALSVEHSGHVACSEGFRGNNTRGTRGTLGDFRGNNTRRTPGALGGFRGNITRRTRGALGGFRGNITRWTRGALGGFRGCSTRVSWDTGHSRTISRVGSPGWSPRDTWCTRNAPGDDSPGWAFGTRGVPESFPGKSPSWLTWHYLKSFGWVGSEP